MGTMCLVHLRAEHAESGANLRRRSRYRYRRRVRGADYRASVPTEHAPRRDFNPCYCGVGGRVQHLFWCGSNFSHSRISRVGAHVDAQAESTAVKSIEVLTIDQFVVNLSLGLLGVAIDSSVLVLEASKRLRCVIVPIVV